MSNDEVRGGELLTTQEAVDLLGITRKTLYVWRQLGEIKPVPGNPAKLRQPRYYRRRDLERLIQRRMSMQQRKAS